MPALRVPFLGFEGKPRGMCSIGRIAASAHICLHTVFSWVLHCLNSRVGWAGQLTRSLGTQLQGRHGPNAEGADLALGFGSGGGFGLDAWLFLPSCCACGARSRHVDWLKARPWQWVKLAAEEKPKGCVKCHVSAFGGKSSSIKKKQRGELGVWSWHPVPGPTVFSWLCRAGG